MKVGPDIARIGAMIGDPARANMLNALLSGKALTATELAAEAGITGQTASAHLKKLMEGGLLTQAKQGRHRYFALAGPEVAEVLEAVAGLAASKGHLRTRTGPRDEQMRAARVCYDHLAGALAVRIFDSLQERGFLLASSDTTKLDLTETGAVFVAGLGIDVASLRHRRRPICRACLDWSERRNHLAGGLGAALLDYCLQKKWMRRAPESRTVHISPNGTQELKRLFPVSNEALMADTAGS